MDFVEPPFGGENVEIPLVSPAVMRPEESEWTKAIRNLDVHRPQEEVAGSVQSWLYLGLLAVLTNKTIDGHDFSTRGAHCSTVISSKLVVAALIEMKVSVLRKPQYDCMAALVRQKTLLVEAETAVRRVESHFSECSSELIDLMILSVKIFIGTVAHSYDSAQHNMFELLCGTSMQWYDIAQKRGDQSKAADRALEAKMIDNGWCVHQIHKILSTFSYQTCYFFARLPRPRSGRLEHANCNKVSCRGWDSKPGVTGARHASDTCTCATVSVSSAEVARIIRSGRIPLVSINEDVHGSLSLELHTKTRYVHSEPQAPETDTRE